MRTGSSCQLEPATGADGSGAVLWFFLARLAAGASDFFVAVRFLVVAAAAGC